MKNRKKFFRISPDTGELEPGGGGEGGEALDRVLVGKFRDDLFVAGKIKFASPEMHSLRLRTDQVHLDSVRGLIVDGTVSPSTLAAKGLIEPSAKVKLLANGEAGQKFEVHAHRVSAAARQKIESAGGVVVLLDAGTS